MSYRKHPSTLSDRQIRRRVAKEKALFQKKVEESLLTRTEPYEVNDIGEQKLARAKDLFQKGVEDTILAHIESCRLNDIEEQRVDESGIPVGKPKKNRINYDCILSYLANTDLNDISDNELSHDSNKIIEDFEAQPMEGLSEDPEIKINEMLHYEGECVDNSLDFFDIIQKLQNDCDDDGEDSDCEDADYLDELLSLDEKDPKTVFMNGIRALCIEFIHTLPHTYINKLLEKLKAETGYPFPKDARTFLKTPRRSTVYQMGIGEYCHYGVESALKSFLASYKIKSVVTDSIKLIVNIDGARFANSSEDSLWIITISEIILNQVELVGVYNGKKKPKDSNELVDRFVNEITNLINNGTTFDDKKYDVILHCLVCDAPAKSYIMKTKLHSGYNSCSKCTIEGDHPDKMIFPTRMQQNAELRTDEKFRNQEYQSNSKKSRNDDFQMGETIMKNIPNFRPITDVVLDYMHLICLGIMLKLIELWIQNPKVILSEYERKKISDLLTSLKEYMPSDFSRNPRNFENVRRLWKAHELRSFLLYTGPIVLSKILPEDFYLNFLCLHVAISILVNPRLCVHEEYLSYAEKLLTEFVRVYEDLYGEKNMVFNIHNVLHLVNDVRSFGCLDSFSAFRFENHIRKVKQLVRKGEKVLQQIGNRLAELRASKEYCDVDTSEETDFSAQAKLKPFEVIKKNSLKLDCRNDTDKFVLLDNGTYLDCQYFLKESDGQIKIFGYPFQTIKHFYEHPLKSSVLNINIIQAHKVQGSIASFPYQSIFAKVCKFPSQKQFVAVPLIHTFKRD